MSRIERTSEPARVSVKSGKGGKRKFMLTKKGGIASKPFPVYLICNEQSCNTNTGGCGNGLRFGMLCWEWKDKISKHTPEAGCREASWGPAASMGAQSGVFLRNLKALGHIHTGVEHTSFTNSSMKGKADLAGHSNTGPANTLSSMASNKMNRLI